MTKILIITDSLGLPRDKPELCTFEDTWPYLIRNNNVIVHQVSIGGGRITDLYKQLQYHKLFNPDMVIIQAGIVDCAPRALTFFENFFLNNFKVTRGFLKYILPYIQNSLRKYRKATYTDSKKFEEYVQKIKSLFSKSSIYWIQIMPSSEDYESKLPGVTTNINKYNEILLKNMSENLITVQNIEMGLMSDNIHLNSFGHEVVFNAILSKTKVLKKKLERI